MSHMLNTFTKGTLYLAEGGQDPFDRINTLSALGITKFQLIATGIFVLAIVIAGIAYGIGGAELKKMAKAKFTDVLLAIVAVYAGSLFIEWIVRFVQGQG